MKQRKMCNMNYFTPSFDVRVSKFDQVIVVRTSFLRLIKILFYLSIYFVHTFMFCKLAPAEQKPRKSNKVASPSKTATFYQLRETFSENHSHIDFQWKKKFIIFIFRASNQNLKIKGFYIFAVSNCFEYLKLCQKKLARISSYALFGTQPLFNNLI